MTTTLTRCLRLALVLGVLTPVPAYAQLDPLLFLKTTQPNVILAVDTGNRMQRDADDTYYDMGTWTKTGAGFEGALGLATGEASTSYRRKFFTLAHSNINDANEKFTASRIAAVGDLEADYATFYERTRLAIARRAMLQAIADNSSSARFALIRMRQGTINIATGNESPVVINDSSNMSQTMTGDAGINKWKITRNLVSNTNSSQTTSGKMVGAADSGALSTIRTILNKSVTDAGTNMQRLVPAGLDTIQRTPRLARCSTMHGRMRANSLPPTWRLPAVAIRSWCSSPAVARARSTRRISRRRRRPF
jgi:hypothetical protein